MDYSNLTIEQILELLKQSAPELHQALTTPISQAKYSEYGKLPLEVPGVANDLKLIFSNGYDPGLMQEFGKNNETPYLNDTQGTLIQSLFQYPKAGASTDAFPSDESPYYYNDDANWIENLDTGEITSELGYLSPNTDEPPAVASAELFNSLSDEDLLKLLLKNKA